MQRRSLMIAGIAALGLTNSVPAWAATRSSQIAQLQAYLNAIHTLKAQFIQLAPDGAETRGTAWLQRPGRMRFQYDPPSPLLLVAGHGTVIFRDNQLDQTSRIPIANSPLGILLADHIDLTGGDVTVRSLQDQPGEIDITLARAASPDQGQLTLTFSTDPLQLRAWTVTDAQHNQTKVTLQDLDTGSPGFNPALFDYKDPNLAVAHHGN